MDYLAYFDGNLYYISKSYLLKLFKGLKTLCAQTECAECPYLVNAQCAISFNEAGLEAVGVSTEDFNSTALSNLLTATNAICEYHCRRATGLESCVSCPFSRLLMPWNEIDEYYQRNGEVPFRAYECLIASYAERKYELNEDPEEEKIFVHIGD